MKIRVGILFGGKSAEHEVSLQSAKNIVEAIDREKYEVVLIGIDKSGGWSLNDSPEFLLNSDDPSLIRLNPSAQNVALVPGNPDEKLVGISGQKGPLGPVDVVFPVLHGPFGEDGTVQGLLKLANVPFVGPGVLGSAAGMDKDVMKRLFREAGIPTPKFRSFNRHDEIDFEITKEQLGVPMFVKPANMGSSVGVTKALDRADFDAAVKSAFQYDDKILVEENIDGREIECSVLGNDQPIASIPGEVIPRHDYYSYEAKYLDENGAVPEIPARLPKETVEEVQRLALKTFKTLCCEGMARVDFFLKGDSEVLVSELNTIPGFTKISMYPRLLKASGISYTELIDRLIQLALERYRREDKLKTSI